MTIGPLHLGLGTLFYSPYPPYIPAEDDGDNQGDTDPSDLCRPALLEALEAVDPHDVVVSQAGDHRGLPLKSSDDVGICGDRIGEPDYDHLPVTDRESVTHLASEESTRLDR